MLKSRDTATPRRHGISMFDLDIFHRLEEAVQIHSDWSHRGCDFTLCKDCTHDFGLARKLIHGRILEPEPNRVFMFRNAFTTVKITLMENLEAKSASNSYPNASHEIGAAELSFADPIKVPNNM